MGFELKTQAPPRSSLGHCRGVHPAAPGPRAADSPFGGAVQFHARADGVSWPFPSIPAPWCTSASFPAYCMT